MVLESLCFNGKGESFRHSGRRQNTCPPVSFLSGGPSFVSGWPSSSASHVGLGMDGVCPWDPGCPGRQGTMWPVICPQLCPGPEEEHVTQNTG